MDEKLVEVKFLGWMTHPPKDNPALLLHAEETNRIIPIWVDLATVTEYSARETGATRRRPGMHEVLVDSLDVVGQSALRGQITGVHEGAFIANLVLEGGVEIDIRPSDLILIIREFEVPPYVARDVLDATSVATHLVAASGGSFAGESEIDSVEASVSEFAEFLDSVDADYFVESHEDMEGKRSDGETDGDIDSASDGDR